MEIEIDAKVVADWMVGSTSINTVHSGLISDCRNNQCVDFLTKEGATQKQDFRIYDDPPVDISILLYYDSIGMYFERLCLNSNF